MSFENRLIDSKNNTTYKRFVKIAKNKDKQNCLLEGIHLCQEFLKNDTNLTLKYAVFQSTALKKALATDTHNELKALYLHVKDKALILADSLFKQLCDVTSHQGVLFIIEVPQHNVEDRDPTRSIVMLDRLQDPGNLGTIIRTTVAAGIDTLLLSKGSVNPWSTKVLRSAQGAHFSLNIYMDCDLESLTKDLKMPVYATSLNNQAKSLYDMQLPQQCVWLFGNEGQGVSAKLLKQATEHIFIPQSAGVESLNVAVACGIVLFEHRRQLLAL